MLQIILVTLVSLSILSISLFLFYMASGESVLKLNILNYSFWAILITCFFSSNLAAYNLDDFYYISENVIYGDMPRRFSVLGTIYWTLLGIPFGAIILNKILGIQNIKLITENFRLSKVEIGHKYSEHQLLNYLLFIFIIISTVFYFKISGSTPLLNLIDSGDVVGSQILRRKGESFLSLGIFDYIFNAAILQWLFYIIYGMSILTKSYKWKIFSWFSFTFMIFLNIADTSISRVIFFIVGIAYIRSLLAGKFFKFHELLFLPLLLALAFIFFKGASGDIFEVLVTPVVSRIFFSQLIGMFHAFEIFPEQHEFLLFSTTGREIHNLLGLDYLESYGVIMMEIFTPIGVQNGYAGHLTTIFMGEAWANFGLVGLIVAPIWVGFVVQFLYLNFSTRNKNIIFLSLYVWLSLNLSYLSDFISFYYPIGLIIFFLSTYFIIMLGRIYFDTKNILLFRNSQ